MGRWDPLYLVQSSGRGLAELLRLLAVEPLSETLTDMNDTNSMGTKTAAAAFTRWLTRQRHGIADKKEVLTFWLAPSRPADTQLRVGIGPTATTTAVLYLHQWKPDVVGKGTGGYVWGGARRLAAHLAEHGDGRGPCPAGTVAVPGQCPTSPPPASPPLRLPSIIELRHHPRPQPFKPTPTVPHTCPSRPAMGQAGGAGTRVRHWGRRACGLVARVA